MSALTITASPCRMPGAEVDVCPGFVIPENDAGQVNTWEQSAPVLAHGEARDIRLSNGRLPARERFAMPSPSYVYLMRAGPYCKIGKADDIERRLAQLQTSCPEPIQLWASIRADNDGEAYRIERELHEDLADQKTSGEWFWWEDQDHGHLAVAWKFSHYGAIVSRGELFSWYRMYLADKFARERPAVFAGNSWMCDIIAVAKDYWSLDPGFFDCVTAQWKALRGRRITRIREMTSYLYETDSAGRRCVVVGYAMLNRNGVLIICHIDKGLSMHSASTRWMEHGTIKPGKDNIRFTQ